MVTARRTTVRREVLTVSADPLSPERGNYGFAQRICCARWPTTPCPGGLAAADADPGAAGIAQQLRCQPLLDRAETIQPAMPRTAAS